MVALRVLQGRASPARVGCVWRRRPGQLAQGPFKPRQLAARTQALAVRHSAGGWLSERGLIAQRALPRAPPTLACCSPMPHAIFEECKMPGSTRKP